MKHFFIALFSIVALGLSACSSDVVVKYSEVPAPVKTFMSAHFAGQPVKMAKADMDDAVREYDIYLTNGTKVEIDAAGTWKEVSNVAGLTTLTMLPDTTAAYLKANYDTQKVVKAEKDSKGYEVKFANGKELKFNADGVFLRVDD